MKNTQNPHREAEVLSSENYLLENIDLSFVDMLLNAEKYTYKEFADFLGMTESEFKHNIKNDNKKFTMPELIKIAEYINVPIISLLK